MSKLAHLQQLYASVAEEVLDVVSLFVLLERNGSPSRHSLTVAGLGYELDVRRAKWEFGSEMTFRLDGRRLHAHTHELCFDFRAI